jgi:hypothetical protein
MRQAYVNAFDSGIYKIFVEKQDKTNILNAFWGILINSGYNNVFFIPFTRVCLKMKTYQGLNSSERSGNLLYWMNISNTLSIYHNS